MPLTPSQLADRITADVRQYHESFGEPFPFKYLSARYSRMAYQAETNLLALLQGMATVHVSTTVTTKRLVWPVEAWNELPPSRRAELHDTVGRLKGRRAHHKGVRDEGGPRAPFMPTFFSDARLPTPETASGAQPTDGPESAD